jgi:MHS family proline/betaine transporter-like MFS transporter
MNAFMNKLFPANTRYSGIAFGYGVGMATLGGTLAVVAALLIEITGNTMAPAFYLMALGCLGLLITQVGKRIAYGKSNIAKSFDGTALPKTKEAV